MSDAIKQVARDKALQKSIVNAMFHECERGTDLWEWLEGDGKSFSTETQTLLWGKPLSDEDEDEELDCLYNRGNPHKVIEDLLDEVEKVMFGPDEPAKPTVVAANVATEIDQAAQEWEDTHLQSWGRNGKRGYDPSMVKVGREDAADLRQVATYVREGNFTQARRKGASLDTIVRDELPESFFRLLEQNNVRW